MLNKQFFLPKLLIEELLKTKWKLRRNFNEIRKFHIPRLALYYFRLSRRNLIITKIIKGQTKLLMLKVKCAE